MLLTSCSRDGFVFAHIPIRPGGLRKAAPSEDVLGKGMAWDDGMAWEGSEMRFIDSPLCGWRGYCLP